MVVDWGLCERCLERAGGCKQPGEVGAFAVVINRVYRLLMKLGKARHRRKLQKGVSSQPGPAPCQKFGWQRSTQNDIAAVAGQAVSATVFLTDVLRTALH